MPSEFYSPRVNSAKFPEFINKTVRLPCKVIHLGNDTATVEAADGGQISVQFISSAVDMAQSTFMEVIGNVIDNNTLKALSCCSLGQEFDLQLANRVILMTFDDRFREKLFE